ncbi:MAG: 50S ribosomal protein L23 [Candidatus Parcubacteria bacterium]|nr:50S ribosomal protein L23 [Candidatus Parcubacteria bacterium]
MSLFSKKSKKPIEDKEPASDKKITEQPAVKKEEKHSVPASATPKITKSAYRVLLRPIITEKATDLSALDKYVFEVAPTMNKIEVKKGVKELYSVTVLRVNIIKNMGKVVRYGKSHGRTKNWKKAIVTLKKGDKINFTTHQ